MEVLMRDLYCFECSLQFDIKYVYDVHFSVVHGEKLDIKQDPDYYQSSGVVGSPEFKTENQDVEDICENESKKAKRIKVSTKTSSGIEVKEQFKCNICNANFGQKDHLNIHVATVHEGKKQFLAMPTLDKGTI